MEKHKVILSVAPVAAAEPLLPEQAAEEIIRCIDQGAAMCHLHCKDEAGRLTDDISGIQQTYDIVLSQRDVVVQVSTGGISDMSIEQRCLPLDCSGVETASLNGGSTNLGEAVYINSMDDIRYCAQGCYQREILPEIEVFDIGMIDNILRLQKSQPFRQPLLFNLVFGHKGGMQPTSEALTAFRSFVPPGALWGVTHFGRDNWHFLAQAMAMGAALVRIGFEDSAYLDPDTDATKNWQLVRRLADLSRAMGFCPATPDEARKILGLV